MTLHQGAEYLRRIGAISPELVNDEDRMALTLGLIGELSALMKPLTLEEMQTFLQNAFANDFLNPPKIENRNAKEIDQIFDTDYSLVPDEDYTFILDPSNEWVILYQKAENTVYFGNTEVTEVLDIWDFHIVEDDEGHTR